MSDRALEREAEQSTRQRLLERSPLEQAVAVGVNGPPEWRRGERSSFLGQFPEQVLKAATAGVLSDKALPDELQQALSDQRCRHVYLSAAAMPLAGPVLRVIKERNLGFTVVHSPEYQNGAAIVLTTDQPHDATDVWVGKQ